MEVLRRLNFNLVLTPPIKLLVETKFVQYEEENWFQALLLLEIAATNHAIISNYKWADIVEAILLMFKPLSTDIDENLPRQVYHCCKRLLIERSQLEDNYGWLFRKYQSYKYKSVARKAYTFQ